jgi:hypothetical protein
MERSDQCVAPGGVVSSVSRMVSAISLSPIVRGVPGLGSSGSPSGRCAAKRRRHFEPCWRPRRPQHGSPCSPGPRLPPTQCGPGAPSPVRSCTPEPVIPIPGTRDLEQLLRGFNAACDARRQRVLQGRTPNQVVAGRLAARRKLRGTRPSGQAGPSDIAKARIIVENAKDVSQPDTRCAGGPRCRG